MPDKIAKERAIFEVMLIVLGKYEAVQKVKEIIKHDPNYILTPSGLLELLQ